MSVIIDVILAIAVVAAALGAVAEFQFRIGHVCPSADRAFVPVLGSVYHPRTGMGCAGAAFLIGLCPICIGAAAIAGPATKLILPAVGQNMDAIASKEQEIVQHGEQREEIQLNHFYQKQQQIGPGQILHLQRNNVHQQHLTIRVQGSQGQEKTQVEIEGGGGGVQNQRGNVHNQYARQIKQVEFQCAPGSFHHPSNAVIGKQKQE